ncbi:hypothetical protein VTO42DRAFT_3451 [Malbranchea cinnamomea]
MAHLLQPAAEPPTELGRYRILSAMAGIRVSPLRFGGMSIGQAWAREIKAVSKEQAFALLDAFVAAGGNFIDTALNYHDGESEAGIAEWMAQRGNRDEKVIATKFTADHKSSVKGKTDWIDILYVHRWEYVTSIEEVMNSLHILGQQGRVLCLGVSNTPAWVVSAANYYAAAHGNTPFSIYQGRWNVMSRGFEREIIPMAQHFAMALAPWAVVGRGKSQTKRTAEELDKTERLRVLTGERKSEAEIKISEALTRVASEHRIDSVTAIAIAYVRAKAKRVFPIVGARKVEHLQDNIRALSIKLTAKQVDYLDSVIPF